MITPILLCGGNGTRLWPLSRKSYPKQFVSLTEELSLFQKTAMRLRGASLEAPVAICNEDYRFIVEQQLASVGITAQDILLEPEGRNTAPAILAAAIRLVETDPATLMLVAPADHVMPDVELFQDAVLGGVVSAQDGNLVTFGIKPTHAETGYGYLELTSDPVHGQAQPLIRFVEKPNKATAMNMIASDRFLWNAGIFLFRADTIITAFEQEAPGLLARVRRAVELSVSDLNFTRLDQKHWGEIENISLDFAIMERVKNLHVVPFEGKWSDLGDWDAVWRESASDSQSVVRSGLVTSIDCHDTLLRSESEELEIVGIGLNNIMAVAMPDAVLVAHKSRAQDVKSAVSLLSSKEALQATHFPKDHRPWGWFERLITGDRFQVKRICVNPGAALSLQSHHHRSEHWIVVEGTAKVTIDAKVQLLTENQSVYIPLGALHRLENPGKLPMILIEVQSGSYLGEDDIIRYEDIYSRG